MLDNQFMPAIQLAEPVPHFLHRLFMHIDKEVRAQLIQTINGHSNARRTSWVLPINLSGLAKILGTGWCGNILMRQHSLAPLFHAFLDAKTSEDFRELVEHGKGEEAYKNARPSMHMGFSWSVAYCPTCIRSGEAGIPIVRRTHLLSGLAVCHKHGEGLLEFCKVCAHRYRNSAWKLLMRDRCACGGLLRSRAKGLKDVELEQDMKLARVIRGLLDNDMTKSIGTDLAIHMQRNAAKLGILRMKWSAKPLREFMHDKLGSQFVERHCIQVTDQSQFYKRLYLGQPVQKPVAGSALILALFGDEFSLHGLNEGVEAIPQTKAQRGRQDWEVEAEQTGLVALGTKTVTVEEFTRYCRERLRARTEQYPNALRNEVVGRLRPRVQRWLRGHDAAYLDTVLPSKPSFGAPIRWTESVDASLVKHMREQHRILWMSQGERPFRVSFSLLITGFPGASGRRWRHVSLPLSKAARLELEETREQFRQRMLCRYWLARGYFANAEAAMSRIQMLSDKEVRTGINYEATLLRRRAVSRRRK